MTMNSELILARFKEKNKHLYNDTIVSLRALNLSEFNNYQVFKLAKKLKKVRAFSHKEGKKLYFECTELEWKAIEHTLITIAEAGGIPVVINKKK